MRSDPETSILMDQIGLWCGPFTTLAAMPVVRGTRIFHSTISAAMLIIY